MSDRLQEIKDAQYTVKDIFVLLDNNNWLISEVERLQAENKVLKGHNETGTKVFDHLQQKVERLEKFIRKMFHEDRYLEFRYEDDFKQALETEGEE